MDVFKVHRQLIDDYKSFTTSPVTPLNPRIAQYVKDELAEGSAIADWVTTRVVRLSCTAIDMYAMARYFGHQGGAFRWEREERRSIRLASNEFRERGQCAGGRSGNFWPSYGECR